MDFARKGYTLFEIAATFVIGVILFSIVGATLESCSQQRYTQPAYVNGPAPIVQPVYQDRVTVDHHDGFATGLLMGHVLSGGFGGNRTTVVNKTVVNKTVVGNNGASRSWLTPRNYTNRPSTGSLSNPIRSTSSFRSNWSSSGSNSRSWSSSRYSSWSSRRR
jgi:hypothetical protein